MTAAERQALKAEVDRRRREQVGFDGEGHGTAGEYARGCRCAHCRTSETDRKRAWRISRTLPDCQKTYVCYTRGCRSSACAKAWRVYMRDYYWRRKSA